jgi:hypothetical protein
MLAFHDYVRLRYTRLHRPHFRTYDSGLVRYFWVGVRLWAANHRLPAAPDGDIMASGAPHLFVNGHAIKFLHGV